MVWYNPLSWIGFDGPTDRISWLQVLIMSAIPLGQLYARVEYYQGSLDKPWLLPFMIFPFSLIAMIMIKYGAIKDGKGTKPTDIIMLFPVVMAFILPTIVEKMYDSMDIDSSILVSITVFIFHIFSIIIANLKRRYDNCKSITMDSFGKASIDSIIAYAVGIVVPFALPFIPVVGGVWGIVKMLPFIGTFVENIFWSISFLATYIIINMINQDDIEKFCSTPFGGNLQDKIPFIASSIAIPVISMLGNFI